MEDQLVTIVAFTNPHTFWFLYEKDRAKLVHLEQSLLKHENDFEETSVITKDIVAVHDIKLWKRAVVQNYRNETSKYECWLIDYGKALLTDRIYVLPKCFVNQPFIQPAALYNTVPLTSSFNIELGKLVHETLETFCPGTVKVAADYIKKAELITFRLHKVLHGVFCGSLFLKIDGCTVDLTEKLVKENHVTLNMDLFLKAMEENLPMMHVPCGNNVIEISKSIEPPEDLSIGKGRGYQRHIKNDIKLAGISKTASETTELMQNKRKNGSPRRSSTKSSLVAFDERLSPRTLSSRTSSERSDDGRFEKSQPKTNADLNSLRVDKMTKSPVERSMRGIKDCLNKLKDLPANTESLISLETIENYSPNKSSSEKSMQDERGIRTSPQSNKSHNSDVGSVSPGTFDLKALIKGRGKSKTSISPTKTEFSLNKNDITNISSSLEAENTLDLTSGESPLSAKTNVKQVIPKSRKHEDDMWEDADENDDTCSQDTTDCSLNKSTFDDSSDIYPYKSPVKELDSSESSNYKDTRSTSSELNDLSIDDKKSSSSVVTSASDNDVSLKPSIRTKMKVGCQCEECCKWDADDFAEKAPSFADSKCIMKKREACKPPPLFKDQSSPAGNVEMKKVERKRTKIEKDIEPCLLVHSLHIPSFVSGVVDVAFCNTVHSALNYLQFNTAYTIQTYAWPAIMRLMNTCVVGSPNTGKTMCYLPAMCSFVIEKQSRCADLPLEKGPLVIVLCESLHKVEETYNAFVNVLEHTRQKVVNIAFVLPPLEKTYLKSIKFSDILIATPKMLLHLLTTRIINLKRLCHLVIEDADKILMKHGKEFDTITKGIESMLDHRVCFYGVQVITVSETWTQKLESFLKKLDNEPIICISDYLQCAIYARARIQMHFVKIHIAKATICSMVKEKSGNYKTIIVCNQDAEVLEIGKLLQVEGASVIIVTSNMMTEEISEEEFLWYSTTPGRHSVLICTDVTLNTQLSITQADILIHYSLPEEHWTVFSKRFKSLLDNYECPFNTKFQPERSCEVHVFVNDNCSRQYPRLCEFLTRMGTRLPEVFVNLSKSIKENEEQTKIQNNIPLCKVLKLLGHCNIFRCRKRHKLCKKLDLLDWVPASGRVKFKLLSVQDATVFGGRLLEHMDTQRNVRKITDCTHFLANGLKNDVNKAFPIKISAGKLYAWYDKNEDTYHRCKVLKILHEHRITKRAAEVTIRLIDAGRDKRVLTGNLFNLPNQYRDVPPQSVDVYLANILPLDEDEQWSARAKCKILKILSGIDEDKENSYFTGRIVLQIGDSLWLDDIQFYEDLEYARETVALLTLKKKMLDLQMCSYREQQLNDLYKHCESCGIYLPNYIVDAPKAVRKSNQVRPQWAFLEEGYNLVLFAAADSPNRFYVRLQKFNKIFLKLQRDIQELIKNPLYPKIEEVIVGNSYLAQDPEGDEYARVIIRGINDEMVECFFVDFGDSVTVLKNELKYLDDDIISRLPYQAIECSLYGVRPILDDWAYEATDVFYNNNLDSDVQYLKSKKSGDNGRNIYSVIMLDYSTDKTMFINKLLIDCGYALEVENEDLNNVTFPETKTEHETDSDFNNIDETEIIPIKDNEDDSSSDIEEDDDGTWHVCVNDIRAFFKDSFKQNTDGDTTAAIAADKTTSTPIGHDLKPIKALPSVGYSTPDVTWYQTEQLIKMDIQLADVKEYRIHILRKSIFSFSTIKNDREYKLSFQLFDKVNQTFQHNGGGLLVRVTLTKEKPAEWKRLTFLDKKMRNIRYDMSKYVFPDEEKKRLFLEIGKDNPDEIDEDEIVIEIGSDVDYSESDIDTDFESD